MEAMISLDGVSVEYQNGVKALNDVSLSIAKGEFAFVVGSTGSGKSTMLRLLYREMLPTKGIVTVGGQNVTALSPNDVPFLRRKLGIVFQDFKLLPQKNLWENLAFALRVIGAPPREIRRRIGDALAMVGLTHRCDSFPHQMSGGEQQRAAIARALVNHPTVLIADEPTGNLDSNNGKEVMDLLGELNAEGTTIIMVTHSQSDGEKAHRIINLLDGQVISEKQIRIQQASAKELEVVA